MSSKKPTITRAHAACILFAKSHTPENEAEYLSKLDELGHGLVICHYGDPERPVLVQTATSINTRRTMLSIRLSMHQRLTRTRRPGKHPLNMGFYVSTVISQSIHLSDAAKMEIGICWILSTPCLGAERQPRTIRART